jgi:hypothetical protein
MRGVMRFGTKGKLSPRYLGPFQVLMHVSPLAYKVQLPPSLARNHDMFHVLKLPKCIQDPSDV